MKADSSDVPWIRTALEYQPDVSHFSGHQTTATGFVVFALSRNIRSSFCATNFISCIANETYHLRHEHAQLLCALWRHRHARFVGGITDLDVCEVLQEQVRAKHTCLWTQIRLRFEASYNTRGPIRQRHLSLRKQNSFNCTRLGSPALVEGQWPWGLVWTCGKRYENVWNYESDKSFLPAFKVGNQPKALDGLVISRAFLRHLVDKCQRSWPCLRRAKMCTRSAVRVAGAKGWHHHGTTLPKDGAMMCHDQGHQGDGHSSFSALHCSKLLEGLEVNAAPDHVWCIMMC